MRATSLLIMAVTYASFACQFTGAQNAAAPAISSQPYSADVFFQPRAMPPVEMKWNVDGEKTRIEILGGGDESPSLEIIRPDLKKIYFQSPLGSSTKEVELTPRNLDPLSILARFGEGKSGLGQAEGTYFAYRVILANRQAIYLWINRSSLLPYRVAMADATFDFKDFSYGPQEAKLFERP